VKNLVLKYCSLLLIAFLFSCSSKKDRLKIEINKDNIVLATEYSFNQFNIYSNDAFSKFIKDLIYTPIFHYNEQTENVDSYLIQSREWIHSGELHLKINTKRVFHDNPAFTLEKGRNINSEDVAHSIQLFQEYSVYPEVRNFLGNIEWMTFKDNATLRIFFRRGVDTTSFMKELALLEIPLIPKEISIFKSPKSLCGTNLYAVDDYTSDQLRLKAFRSHPKYKQLESGFSKLPRNYLLNFGVSPSQQFQQFENDEIDGVFTKDVAHFSKNLMHLQEKPEHVFVRKSDRITFLTFDFERPFSSDERNINLLKFCCNPEDFNAQFGKNQLLTYYSPYELGNFTGFSLKKVNIYFDHIADDYRNYITKNLRKKGVKAVATPAKDADIFLSNWAFPSVESQALNNWTKERVADEGIFIAPDETKETVLKSYQSVNYIVFNAKIRFINENFSSRNDFLSIFKTEN